MYDELYHGEKKRKVLIVDDESINRELLGNMLMDKYDVIYAANGKEAFSCIESSKDKVSLILLDLMMPVMDGYEFIKLYKEDKKVSQIPIIVMTSDADSEAEIIKAGAVDFIKKPYSMPEVILARCERIIDLFEKKRLIDSTKIDELTGLYSKEYFFEYIKQMRESGFVDEVDMDVISIDVENFHLINEVYGHSKGDIVLKRIAEILEKQVENRIGIAARSDADTFYMYVDSIEDYQTLLDDMMKEISSISDFPASIRLRMGVNKTIDDNESPQKIFEHARMACNLVRGDYIHQIGYYDRALHDKQIYNEKLVADIDASIKNKDFVVYYQPKYSIQHGDPILTSAEALVRWNHPTLGMISPGDFIPLFENNGLIQKLDKYVWGCAASQIKKWKDKYKVAIPISVNVSRIDIYDPELENTLIDIVNAYDLKPHELQLEITESAYSDDATRLVEVVNSLRKKDFEIEMDDFGTGYSSLNMLTTIPIDALKMDMSFVRNMHKDNTSLKLVELIIDISRFLDVPVIAEGVEEQSQLDTLRRLGCDIIQGYYFSKPVPAEEFEKFFVG